MTESGRIWSSWACVNRCDGLKSTLMPKHWACRAQKSQNGPGLGEGLNVNCILLYYYITISLYYHNTINVNLVVVLVLAIENT